jgi:hypothetical protein
MATTTELLERITTLESSLRYVISRYQWPAETRGLSSDALVIYMLGGPPPLWSGRPRDAGDLRRCEVAFKAAPPHMKQVGHVVLDEWRVALAATEGAHDA